MMTESRRPGRPPTGTTTTTVRIPLALKPAVDELVATYRRLQWMPSRPLATIPAGTDLEISRLADMREHSDNRGALLELLRQRQAATVERLAQEYSDAERELADTELKIAGL